MAKRGRLPQPNSERSQAGRNTLALHICGPVQTEPFPVPPSLKGKAKAFFLDNEERARKAGTLTAANFPVFVELCTIFAEREKARKVKNPSLGEMRSLKDFNNRFDSALRLFFPVQRILPNTENAQNGALAENGTLVFDGRYFTSWKLTIEERNAYFKSRVPVWRTNAEARQKEMEATAQAWRKRLEADTERKRLKAEAEEAEREKSAINEQQKVC